jgi:hypothetical protein
MYKKNIGTFTKSTDLICKTFNKNSSRDTILLKEAQMKDRIQRESLTLNKNVYFSLSNFLHIFLALGACDPSQLPEIRHGRRVAVKNFRRAVYKYVCDADFKRVGQGQVHCNGDAWDLREPPLCTSKFYSHYLLYLCSARDWE